MIKLLNYIFNNRIQYLYPPKKKILVYDIVNFKYFQKFLKNKNYHILYVRKEIFNLPIMLTTLIKHGIEDLNYKYKLEYIKYVNPKYIITMIDNDTDFLAYKFDNIKKIAIQNAYRRTAFPDIFSGVRYSNKKRYNLDYIFCFNKSIAKIYKNSFGCKTIVIGSLKNNTYKKKKKSKHSIGYVSQYRITASDGGSVFPYHEFKKNFKLTNFSRKNYKDYKDANEFFEDDKRILNYILKYLNNKKIKLHILGVMKHSQKKEYLYYKKICPDFKFKFIKNNLYDKSYKLLDNYQNIIGIDSTMLYEAFARNIKVGFFSVRKSPFINHKVYFGYPFNTKPKGACWTYERKFKEVKRILDYLLKSKYSDYNKDMEDYILNLTYYDENNLKFSKELKNIINQ